MQTTLGRLYLRPQICVNHRGRPGGISEDPATPVMRLKPKGTSAGVGYLAGIGTQPGTECLGSPSPLPGTTAHWEQAHPHITS